MAEPNLSWIAASSRQQSPRHSNVLQGQSFDRVISLYDRVRYV
ncbi:MAG: hypothetical protein ABI465_12055 [Ktedonobacteraceae bacterium]